MSWQTVIPGRIVSHEAKITISSRGVFWISPGAARDYLNGFNRIFVLHNKKERLIGFRPTNEQRGSFAISRRRDRNDATVSGKGTLHDLGISHEDSKSYRASWNNEEDLLQIDLSKPI